MSSFTFKPILSWDIKIYISEISVFPNNCSNQSILVTNILQNVFFCASKKVSHITTHEGE